MTRRSLPGYSVEGLVLDRRAFLGNVSLAAGAVMATALVPLSFVHAAPADMQMVIAGMEGTGSVDDACGHWPPYAHPIPYGRPQVTYVMAANADPIDHNFLL
jgi:hypothetical protein